MAYFIILVASKKLSYHCCVCRSNVYLGLSLILHSGALKYVSVVKVPLIRHTVTRYLFSNILAYIGIVKETGTRFNEIIFNFFVTYLNNYKA